MDFDTQELFNQTKEEIMKTGKYLHIEIVVPDISEDSLDKGVQPLSYIEGNGNSLMAFVGVETMNSIIETMMKKDPELRMLTTFLKNSSFYKRQTQVVSLRKEKEKDE